MQLLQSTSLHATPLKFFRKNTDFSLPNYNVRPTTAKKFSYITASAAKSAPKREKDPKKRVVITGMGVVSVFGNDVDAYYDKLLAGESGITMIDRFDVSKLPTRFGGQIRGFSGKGFIDGKNDRRMDNTLRYCIVAGKKALENAGLGGDNLTKFLDCSTLSY